MPQLFALSSVVSFHAANAGELSPLELLVPAVAAVLATFAVTGGSLAVLRSVRSAAFFASSIAVLLFNYGQIYDLLGHLRIELGSIILGPNKLLYPALVVVVVLLGLWTRRHPEGSFAALKIVTVTGVALLTASLSVSVIAEIESAASAATAPTEQEPLVPSEAHLSDKWREYPDIYYIILDSYGSNDSLEELAGYDNSAFTDYLESKGFFVAYDARSNYTASFMSIAATFNSGYVNDYLRQFAFEDYRSLDGVYWNSEPVRVLKEHGYSYVHITSGYGPTNSAPEADVVLSSGIMSEVYLTFLQTTAVRPFVAARSLERGAYSRTTSAFRLLREYETGDGPTFVFAHIVAPHGPYVLRADGTRAYHPSDTSKEVDGRIGPWGIDPYIEQVQGVNSLTRKVVDRVIDSSDRPVIIVIQGDHGSRFAPAFDFPVFNAFYFSEGVSESLYRSVSPVNTWRIIFGELFHTEVPLLPDESYSTYESDDGTWAFRPVP